eukprot:TRINITY_DN6607_c0_g3_i1.p1 TRINITY_DN6607_c0_g3~~TRINITY_DN6607_c0_g3_i1.p1  ORF type:complete len:839 (+),score=227.05 TRINITY_DN6607_c0_g3_i1:84-2600(+)
MGGSRRRGSYEAEAPPQKPHMRLKAVMRMDHNKITMQLATVESAQLVPAAESALQGQVAALRRKVAEQAARLRDGEAELSHARERLAARVPRKEGAEARSHRAQEQLPERLDSSRRELAATAAALREKHGALSGLRPRACDGEHDAARSEGGREQDAVHLERSQQGDDKHVAFEGLRPRLAETEAVAWRADHVREQSIESAQGFAAVCGARVQVLQLPSHIESQEEDRRTMMTSLHRAEHQELLTRLESALLQANVQRFRLASRALLKKTADRVDLAEEENRKLRRDVRFAGETRVVGRESIARGCITQEAAHERALMVGQRDQEKMAGAKRRAEQAAARGTLVAAEERARTALTEQRAAALLELHSAAVSESYRAAQLAASRHSTPTAARPEAAQQGPEPGSGGQGGMAQSAGSRDRAQRQACGRTAAPPRGEAEGAEAQPAAAAAGGMAVAAGILHRAGNVEEAPPAMPLVAGVGIWAPTPSDDGWGDAAAAQSGWAPEPAVSAKAELAQLHMELTTQQLDLFELRVRAERAEAAAHDAGQSLEAARQAQAAAESDAAKLREQFRQQREDMPPCLWQEGLRLLWKGRGGEGPVYAVDGSAADLAIKVFTDSTGVDAERALAAAVRQLGHPWEAHLILPTEDVYRVPCACGEHRCLTYPTYDGDLGAAAAELPLNIVDALRVLRAMLRGTAVLEQAGKAHGDVKPQNVLAKWRLNNNLTHIALSDLGGSHESPAWQPPDRQHWPPEHSSDVYSVMLVFVAVASGSSVPLPPDMRHANAVRTALRALRLPPGAPPELKEAAVEVSARLATKVLEKTAAERLGASAVLAEMERVLNQPI